MPRTLDKMTAFNLYGKELIFCGKMKFPEMHSQCRPNAGAGMRGSDKDCREATMRQSRSMPEIERQRRGRKLQKLDEFLNPRKLKMNAGSSMDPYQDRPQMFSHRNWSYSNKSGGYELPSQRQTRQRGRKPRQHYKMQVGISRYGGKSESRCARDLVQSSTSAHRQVYDDRTLSFFQDVVTEVRDRHLHQFMGEIRLVDTNNYGAIPRSQFVTILAFFGKFSFIKLSK